MSATVEKATRRDLRRAVGAETVTVVEQLIEFQNKQAIELASAHQRLTEQSAEIDRLVQINHRFVVASVMNRLRWLFGVNMR